MKTGDFGTRCDEVFVIFWSKPTSPESDILDETAKIVLKYIVQNFTG